MRVTRFLFLAAIFCVTFEKVHWDIAGTVSLADILALLFLVMWTLERLAQRDRRLSRTSTVVICFGLAFLLVYLLGYFAIDTADASGQFGKGIFKWAIHILFLVAGVSYLARRSERFYWKAIGVFTAGIVLNAVYGVLQLVSAQGGRNLDNVVGFIHLRQLIGGGDEPIAAFALDTPIFPEAARVLVAMRELQVKRAQMAVVVNEHGGVAGIVTMEDLVEELVGEIYDETDPDLTTVRHEPDGTIVLPGTFPIHDLDDIDVDLPTGDYATVAGLVLERLGRIPVVGLCVEIDGWNVEVRARERHSITEVALTPIVPQHSEDPS